MSTVTQALLANVVVLVAVLEADFGSHRKVGPLRLVRPFLMAVGIIPLFLSRPDTHGVGLVLELAGAAVGWLVGLLALSLISVYESPRTSQPVSRARTPYAALWIIVIGAEAPFLRLRALVQRLAWTLDAQPVD